MLVELLGLGTVFLLNSARVASNFDAEAQRKLRKAVNRRIDADAIVKTKMDKLDEVLGNVLKKRKAVLNFAIPKFQLVYGKIQKVVFNPEKVPVLDGLDVHVEESSYVNNMIMASKKEFSDKEILCGILRYGLCGMIEKDSKNFVAAANKTLSAANVAYSEAESKGLVIDVITEYGKRIADLTSKLNFLFLKVIEQVDMIIEKNGYDAKKYSQYEKEVLTTCVNLAKSLPELLSVQIVDENGIVADASKKLLANGEKYLSEVSSLIKEDL